MRKTIGIFLLIITLTNCSLKNQNGSQDYKEIFSTNFGKIDDTNLQLKFGDLVEFEIDNQKINAIVLDISQEENENWFGICFLNKNQLFGRRIPNGYVGDCIDLFDLTFINEKGLKNFKILEKLIIDFNKVGCGSNSPVNNLNEILRNYERGIKQRELMETPCDKKLRNLNPINECYFPLEKIKQVSS